MAGRGQSGVRMWKKAAIVKPVEPARGKDGVKQPPYLRSHSAAQSSKRLKMYQSFMRKCLQGKHHKGRAAVQKAFADCARQWSAGRGVKAAEYEYGEDDIFWE